MRGVVRLVGDVAAILCVVWGCWPAFAETPEPKLTIVAIEGRPVMGRGAAGAWDSGDVLNPSVIAWRGALYDYYSGFDGSVWRTGLATSSDAGLTWTKAAKPVLDLGAWTKRYIAANGAAIVIEGQIFYYFQGVDANRVPNIGLATSTDGMTFRSQPDPVLKPGQAGAWDDAAVGDPYVARFGDTFYLYFLGMNRAYVQLIGVAKSTDGVNWTKLDGPLLPAGGRNDFDANGQGEPAVVYAAPYYYMLYTGRSSREFRDLGWAVSSDGLHWAKKSGGLISMWRRQYWDSQVICDPTILPTGKQDGTFYVWFGGGDRPEPAQRLHGQIGRMTIKLN